MNAMKWLLVIGLLLSIPMVGGGKAEASSSGVNVLQLKRNSHVLLFNGKQLKAAQPVTIINGSAYLPLRGIAEPFGFRLSFDTKTREAVAASAKQEIRFIAGSASIKVNGRTVQGPGPVFNQKGYMMIPVRMWSNMTGSRISVHKDIITIEWSSKPMAHFEVNPAAIYAGQTEVVYRDLASSSGGSRIVEEKWSGRETVFQKAGTYTITRTVRDENGIWSDPFSVTIRVLAPNKPPTASFETDKALYRMGELILYKDNSFDPENELERRRWTNQELAFFEPGPQTITLTVWDKQGLSSTTQQTITIVDEQLYEREDFYRLHAPVGDKFDMRGSVVLDYPLIRYQFQNEQHQMVRSNSPETWVSTGIAFEDTLNGKTRFMFHNRNGIGENVRMYLAATNVGETAVQVGVGAFGQGGPDTYVSNTGKLSAVRYLDSLKSKPAVKNMTLAPGHSAIVLPDISRVPIKPNQVYSAFADVTSTGPVRYRIVVVRESEDPLLLLEQLPNMARDRFHVRGTFQQANREIVIDERLGETASRIAFGDRQMDTFLSGYDRLTGQQELNIGNYGVMYHVTLTNVAPRTLIGLNGRGGHYFGAFLVNGEIVPVTRNSILKNQHETAVLHRTGSQTEKVELYFLIASGGNLPINVTLTPLPELMN